MLQEQRKLQPETVVATVIQSDMNDARLKFRGAADKCRGIDGLAAPREMSQLVFNRIVARSSRYLLVFFHG